MKTLVAGATGNVGFALVRELLARGHSVRAMVRPGSLRASKLDELDIDKVVTELSDESAWSKAGEGADVMYHLIGYLFAPKRSMIEPLNMAAARDAARLCLETGIKHLVFTSSVLVYGPAATMPSREDDARRPNTAYSRAKAAIEDYLLGLADEGLDVTVLRLGHVYGRNVSTVEEFKSLIHLGAYRLAGPGDHLIPPVHVDDVAKALALAGENEAARGQAYNVNDDQPIPLREFSDLLAREIGRPPVKSAPVSLFSASAALLEFLALFTGNPPFFDRDTVRLMSNAHHGDTAKIKQELGWTPRYPSFREGVKTCF